MAEAFLDSTALIEIIFRSKRTGAQVVAAIPPGAAKVTSQYVIFEIARGFFRSLLVLYNKSLAMEQFSQLHEFAHSGQQIFKKYRREVMLGAFDDYFSLLEGIDAKVTTGQQLAEFKGWLGPHIRRGWRKLEREAKLINAIGCRTDLPAPKTRGDGCYDQKLPTQECGTPKACGLDQYLGNQATSLGVLLDELCQIDDADSETKRRIKSLRRLLEGPRGAKFKGTDCFACGDALICHESPSDSTVISKNKKHFEPLCEILGRTFQGYPVRETAG